MIHVVAVITAKAGQRNTVLDIFRANVPAVHAEKGCIEYVACVDVPDGPPSQAAYGPDTFVVIEKWDTLDDLKAHSAAPHMAAYAARTRELLADRKIHILSPV